MMPFYFFNTGWENSRLPTIVQEDENGGDYRNLAVLKRVHNPDALHDLCRLANEAIKAASPAPSSPPAEALPSQTSEAEAGGEAQITAAFLRISAQRRDVPENVRQQMLTAAALLTALAKPASEPASGGDREALERAAQAAEGPEFWPHPKQPGDRLTYRGTKDGNWLAVKPPFKLDPYSQGRADAAAAVRTLSSSPAGAEALPAGVDAVTFHEAFELIFDAYSAPADIFETDTAWALFLSQKVNKAYGLLQKVRVALSSAPAQEER